MAWNKKRKKNVRFNEMANTVISIENCLDWVTDEQKDLRKEAYREMIKKKKEEASNEEWFEEDLAQRMYERHLYLPKRTKILNGTYRPEQNRKSRRDSSIAARIISKLKRGKSKN